MLMPFLGSPAIWLTRSNMWLWVENHPWTCTPVLSGVPQGSVLGPLLFLVYIDDVSDVLLSDGSTLNLYADDMLLYKPVKSIEDIHHLQMDIDCICDWVT